MDLNPRSSKAELVFPDLELLEALDGERSSRPVRILPFVKDEPPARGRQVVGRRRF